MQQLWAHVLGVGNRRARENIRSERIGPRWLRRAYASNRAGLERRRTMTLSFPNRSRYYDGTLRAVRFWGHDSALEAAFFVTEEAL